MKEILIKRKFTAITGIFLPMRFGQQFLFLRSNSVHQIELKEKK